MWSRPIFLIKRSWCVPWLRSTLPLASGELAVMIRISSFWHMRPKLRHRRLSVQQFLFGRFPRIHVFPVRIQRQRHSVLTDPLPQHTRRRPYGFLVVQVSFHRRARVVHHVHQARFGSALLIPLMETAVQLHQFPKVLPALAALPMLLTVPRLAPQSFGQHPAPQRFRMHLHLVLARQVLGCQGRSEPRLLVPAVFSPNQLQNLGTLFGWPGAVGLPSRVAVLQRPCPALLVFLPQPFGLAVTDPHHFGGFG